MGLSYWSYFVFLLPGRTRDGRQGPGDEVGRTGHDGRPCIMLQQTFLCSTLDISQVVGRRHSSWGCRRRRHSCHTSSPQTSSPTSSRRHFFHGVLLWIDCRHRGIFLWASMSCSSVLSCDFWRRCDQCFLCSSSVVFCQISFHLVSAVDLILSCSLLFFYFVCIF